MYYNLYENNTLCGKYESEFSKTLKVLTARTESDKNAYIDRYFKHRDLPVMTDAGIVQKHELMRSETLDGAAVLVPDLLNLIREGARPIYDPLGEMYDTIPMSTEQLKVPIGSKGAMGSYAPMVNEGETTPVSDDRIKYVMLNARKSRIVTNITREMVRDSKIELVSRDVKNAGVRIANTVQSVALYNLMKASTASTQKVTDAASLVKAINYEIATIQERGYVPDSIMLTPRANAWLRQETFIGHYAGNDPLTNGEIQKLYGMTCYTNGAAPAKFEKDVYTPAAGKFGGTNNIGAIVYSKPNSVLVGIREEVGLDGDFRDIYKDLEALGVSARFDVQPLHTDGDDDVAAAVYISA